MEQSIKCAKCNEPLVAKKTVFDYMGNTFSHDVPVCPECGRVFISRELATGKMSEVERQLEDK